MVTAPIQTEEGKHAGVDEQTRARVPWDGLLLQPALDELEQVLTRCDSHENVGYRMSRRTHTNTRFVMI